MLRHRRVNAERSGEAPLTLVRTSCMLLVRTRRASSAQPSAPQLHSVIHRSATAVTVPAEASGDQPIETGPGVTTGPHPSVWGTRHRL